MANSPLKIVMENPCHESWEGMHARELGRHCDKCQIEVIDFTQMSSREIIHYFQSTGTKKGCGRFYSYQLDTIRIPVNETEFLQGSNYFHKFLLILLFCFGKDLFHVELVWGQEIQQDTMEMLNVVDTLELESTDSIPNLQDSIFDQKKDSTRISLALPVVNQEELFLSGMITLGDYVIPEEPLEELKLTINLQQTPIIGSVVAVPKKEVEAFKATPKVPSRKKSDLPENKSAVLREQLRRKRKKTS